MKTILKVVVFTIFACSIRAQPVVEIIKTSPLENRLLVEFAIKDEGHTLYEGKELTALEWRPELIEGNNLSAEVNKAIRMVPGKRYVLQVRLVANGDNVSSLVSDSSQSFQQYLTKLYQMESPSITLVDAVKKEKEPAEKLEVKPFKETLKTDTLQVQELKNGKPPKRLRVNKSK